MSDTTDLHCIACHTGAIVATERTKEQALANDIDCDFYRLLVRAERMAVENKKWNSVVRAMRDARVPIRKLMCEKDREETV